MHGPRFQLWRQPGFRAFWTASTSAAIGMEATQLALPTVAILALDASPALVGLLVSLPYWAFLLAGLPAGVLVDRRPRRRLMLLALAARLVAVSMIPLFWQRGQLSTWQLIGVAGALGLAAVMFQTAERSYLPQIVAPARLLDANAQVTIGQSAAQVMGPSLAGALIQVVGAPLAFLADSAASIVALGALRAMPEDARRLPGSGPGEPVTHAIADGLRFVLGHPLLRAILVINVAGNLGAGMVDGVVFVYLYQELGLSPAVVGAAMALGGAGFLVTAVGTAALAGRLRLGATLGAAAVVYACAPAALLLGVALGPLAAVVLWRLLYGLALPPYDVAAATIRQSWTPAPLQGRAIAVINTFGWGALGIGPLLGGVVGQQVGVQAAILAGTIICFLAAGPALLPAVRRLDRAPAPGAG